MRFIHIQILRFIAATAVVIFHSLGAGSKYLPDTESFFFRVFKYGDHGVDLFFVISGFIIYYSTHKSNVGRDEFLLRRIERIVPLYWLTTFTFIAIALLFPALFRTPDLLNIGAIIKSLLYISFTLGHEPVIYVGWSLEYEMFFYLMVGLLMPLRENMWNIIVILFSGCVIFGLNPYLRSTSGTFVFFTDPLLLEFIFGIIVAKIFVGIAPSKPAIASIACAFLLLLAIDPGNRVIAAGVPSAILVLAAAYLSKYQKRPSHTQAVLGKLGDASYSIYLVQIFTVSAVFKICIRLIPQLPVDAIIIIITLLTVLAGYGVYTFVERPVLDLCRKLTGSKRRVAPVSSAA